MQAHVTLGGVTKRFPARANGHAVHALGPVDLTIRKGEFFAIVGPSGCGKSTLLDLIAGLLPASDGRVEFEGKPIGSQIPDGIGVVFQEDACFPCSPCATTCGSVCARRRSTTRSASDASTRRSR